MVFNNYENLSIDVRMHVPSKFPNVVQKCVIGLSAHITYAQER